MAKTTVHSILTKALANIRSGWCQHKYTCKTRGRTQYCAIGAIHAVGCQSHLRDDAKNVLRQFVGGSLSLWNDHPERTKAEVVMAFKNAIELTPNK